MTNAELPVDVRDAGESIGSAGDKLAGWLRRDGLDDAG